jgi:hypothetical protein
MWSPDEFRSRPKVRKTLAVPDPPRRLDEQVRDVLGGVAEERTFDAEATRDQREADRLTRDRCQLSRGVKLEPDQRRPFGIDGARLARLICQSISGFSAKCWGRHAP